MKRLIICEKPSIARDVAAALGIEKKGNEYRSSDIIVTYCFGHLISLYEPDEYKAKIDTLEDLPYVPNPFKRRPRDKDCEKRLNEIAYLISEVDIIVNACDAGREGELIFRLVYDYCEKYMLKPLDVERMWIQSNTKEGILEAWKTKKLNDPSLEGLYKAGKARMEADWLFGINGSIATKLYMNQKTESGTWSIGRVQCGILGVILDRHHEIQHFTSNPYYGAYIKFPLNEESREVYNSKLQVTEGGMEFRNQKGLYENSREISIMLQLLSRSKAEPWSVVDKDTKLRVSPPLAFNLSELQQCMCKYHRWGGSKTLEVLQKLYEKGLVSYPRTDCRFYHPSLVNKAQEIYNELVLLKDLVSIDIKDTSGFKKLFNAKKVTDHFGLMPWKVVTELENEEEELLYNTILNRFILSMSNICVLDIKERMHIKELVLDRECFNKKAGDVIKAVSKTTFKKVETHGWTELAFKYKQDMPLETMPDDKFPSSVSQITNVEIEDYKRMSMPPENYTEDELLRVIDKLSLGTAATRSNIIDTLLLRDYIKRAKRAGSYKVVMSQRGIILSRALRESGGNFILQPTVISNWDKNLQYIEGNKPFLLDIKEFMVEVEDYTKRYIEVLRKDLEKGTVITDTICPISGEPIKETNEAYIFPGNTKLLCPKEYDGIFLTRENYIDLLEGKTIGPFRFKSKRGRRYKANIIFKEDLNRIQKEFL